MIQYYNLISTLNNLKQKRLVQAYLDKFDQILNRRVYLSEKYHVSGFLSGLKEEI